MPGGQEGLRSAADAAGDRLLHDEAHGAAGAPRGPRAGGLPTDDPHPQEGHKGHGAEEGDRRHHWQERRRLRHQPGHRVPGERQGGAGRDQVPAEGRRRADRGELAPAGLRPRLGDHLGPRRGRQGNGHRQGHRGEEAEVDPRQRQREEGSQLQAGPRPEGRGEAPAAAGRPRARRGARAARALLSGRRGARGSAACWVLPRRGACAPRPRKERWGSSLGPWPRGLATDELSPSGVVTFGSSACPQGTVPGCISLRIPPPLAARTGHVAP
mmetsp:Transcript_85763/g.223813  ORF Transcript_85763/g.223813 Transcript_85763/m.223813 type:complete len:270 (-) Transcript_85763:530-1339(-)